MTKAKEKNLDIQETELDRQEELTQAQAELKAADATRVDPEAPVFGTLGAPTPVSTLQSTYNAAGAEAFDWPSSEPLNAAWEGVPAVGDAGEPKLLHPYAQQAGGGVFAQTADEDGLRHSAGGSTTRNDALDLGVPMKQGSPFERQGPEDALGLGPKRGDYRGRLGYDVTIPHEGAIPQGVRVFDIGDAPGKGGVDSDLVN